MVSRKVGLGAVIGFVLLALKTFAPNFFPGLEFPEGLQDAIMLVIVFVSQFFVRETNATKARMIPKP